MTGHVILTEADGRLRTPTDEIDRMVDAIVERGRGVIHFHGGLVDEEKGLAIARSLEPVYTGAGAYPVFFVWRSGVREILSGNLLREIGDEAIFKQLLKIVLKFAAGKVKEELGVRAVGEAVPTETEVARELQAADEREPFADLEPSPDVPELTPEDEARIEREVMEDLRLQGAVQAAIAAQAGEGEAQARGGAAPAAGRSLADPEALAEVSSGEEGARGLLSTAALARKALKIATAVISRFRSGRDHGVYVTVVEEILREFYFGAAGAIVWQMMKRETADTFAAGDGDRGGAYLLERLGAALAQEPRPEISLVGHSTGAVFINNLLGAVEARRQDPENPFPADFTFRHIVFLAPACTFADFAKVIPRWEHLWRDFRMFTMTDEAESRDALVKVVYPRSLLYFVSGVLERDAEGKGEPAKPVVGLARYFQRDPKDLPEEVVAVRAYIAQDADKRVVWSPATGAAGFSSGATSHGAFDDDEQVRASLGALIAAGP